MHDAQDPDVASGRSRICSGSKPGCKLQIDFTSNDDYGHMILVPVTLSPALGRSRFLANMLQSNEFKVSLV